MTLPEGTFPAPPTPLVQPRDRGCQTRVNDAEGNFLRYDPGPVEPGWEERLEVVLARRQTTGRVPGQGRWNTQTPPVWMPDAPAAAAALNRERLAAERAVDARRRALEVAEQQLARRRELLQEAEQRAALLTAAADGAGAAPLPATPTPEQLPRWLTEWTASGPALADARRRYGLSQRKLARLAHYSRSYVSDLELEQPRGTVGHGRRALAARRRLALLVAQQAARRAGGTAQEVAP